MEIYIMVGDKINYSLKKVEAKEIKMKGDFRFFYHSSSKNKINITEYSTGRAVLTIDDCKNPEKVFIDYMKKNKDFVNKISKAVLKLPKIYHNR